MNAEGRARPSWDEVRHKQARSREQAEERHLALVKAAPVRPDGVWRVCGLPLDPSVAGGGCTCHPGGPFPEQVSSANRRLASAPAGGGS